MEASKVAGRTLADELHSAVKTYNVRKMPGAGWYEVAMFNGHQEPDAIYDVKGDFCNCRGGMGPEHKHVQLVRQFQQLGEPWLTTFWQRDDKWEWYRILIPEDDPRVHRRKRKC